MGINGGKWAWENFPSKDPKVFSAVQNSWNKAGKIGFFVSLGIGVLVIIIYATVIAAFINEIRNYGYY